MKPALARVGVLVTRPAGQSARLAELIGAAGGEPILFPAMRIEPLQDIGEAGALNDLRHFALLIFVSPNAVRVAMRHIASKGGVPASARVAAVGSATATELKKSGVRDIISPRTGSDSEALVQELSSLRLAGSRVLVIRGQGGREFLGDTLRSRGAAVEYLECYRRVKPDRDLNELLPLWRSGALKASIATSSSIVMNLYEMAGEAGRQWLSGTTFFVSHPRVAATAFVHGAQRVFVAGNGDEALVAGMKTWFAGLRSLHTST